MATTLATRPPPAERPAVQHHVEGACCAICLEPAAAATPKCFTTACRHTFHTACLFELLGHNMLSANDNAPHFQAHTDTATDNVILRMKFKTTRCPLCRARIYVRYSATMFAGFMCSMLGQSNQMVRQYFNVGPMVQQFRVTPASGRGTEDRSLQYR